MASSSFSSSASASATAAAVTASVAADEKSDKQHYFEPKELSDFVVTAGGDNAKSATMVLHVHRVILINSCRYFDALLMADRKLKTLHLPQSLHLPLTVLPLFMRVMYAPGDHRASVKEKDFPWRELAAIARYFDAAVVRHYVDRLAVELCSQMYEGDAAERLVFAEAHQLAMLAQLCEDKLVPTFLHYEPVGASCYYTDAATQQRVLCLERVPSKRAASMCMRIAALAMSRINHR